MRVSTIVYDMGSCRHAIHVVAERAIMAMPMVIGRLEMNRGEGRSWVVYRSDGAPTSSRVTELELRVRIALVLAHVAPQRTATLLPQQLAEVERRADHNLRALCALARSWTEQMSPSSIYAVARMRVLREVAARLDDAER